MTADRNPQTTCDLLDAMLAGDLDAAAAQQFETHLTSCAECRTAVQQDQWLVELLRSADAAALESPPPAQRQQLSDRLTTARNARRPRTTALGVAATAAALLVVALLWPRGEQKNKIPDDSIAPLANRHDASEATSPSIASGNNSRQTDIAQNAKPQIDAAATPDVPARTVRPSGKRFEDALTDESRRTAAEGPAEFLGSGAYIALEMESPSPDVTVYQVYTTTDAARRDRLAATLFRENLPSNGELQ